MLMEKLNNLDKRIWYAQKTIENGWSRNMLALWIDSNLHERQGKAPCQLIHLKLFFFFLWGSEPAWIIMAYLSKKCGN